MIIFPVPMEKIKALIRNFFAFSKKETNAFLILLPLMVLLIFSEPVYRYFFTHQQQVFSKEQKKLDSLVATLQDSITRLPEQTIEMKNFDPNRASVEELTSVGFSKELATRLVNYRSKGGKFATKKDLLKLYGFDEKLYQRVHPYISLPEQLTATEFPSVKSSKKMYKEKVVIDLNMADTAQLKQVYGIGNKLAERIVKYREKVGGFISIDQLREVYGLDSAVVQEVKKDFFISPEFQPKKLKVNLAKQEELAAHPYINRALAKNIVAYRFQHGSFMSFDELSKVQLMKEATLQKLKPYISFDPQ
ncbi:MAG: ComEA family DNA-binding protein [Flammeovirgaceae bacterium]